MKLFGFAQWIGVFLILALLFGFLGSRQQADDLQAKLTASDTELIATKKERQGYLDQVTDLQGKMVAAAARETKLNDNLSALEKAKAGLENTMKTQVANLEKANQAVSTAKAKVESELKKVTEDGQAKEAELSGTIKELEVVVSEGKLEISSLQRSLDDLGSAKKEVEAQLEKNAGALKEVRAEAQELRTEAQELRTQLEASEAQLDQSEKSNSELQKKIDALEESLKAQEEEAKEAEETEEEAQKQVQELEGENSRLQAALQTSRQKVAEFKTVVDRTQPVEKDQTIAAATGVREADLLRQLEEERKDREAIADFLKQLRGKVKEIQGELSEAQSADL